MISKVYKLSASWCAPCKTYAPIFDKVMEKYNGQFEVYHVDVDNCTEEESALIRDNNVLSIPTTLILDENGVVIEKLRGVFYEKDLTTVIENALNK